MKFIPKQLIFFLIIILSILFSMPGQAVHPVGNEIQITELSDQSEPNCKNDLTWKEKLALKLIEKKIKKAKKKLEKEGKNPTNFSQENRCYTMVLKNGEERKILLIKVSETEVIYKPCGNPDYPDITIPKEEVGQIKDQYNNLMYKASDFTPHDQQKMGKVGLVFLAALIFGLLGFKLVLALPFLAIILFIMAGIFGLVSLITLLQTHL